MIRTRALPASLLALGLSLAAAPSAATTPIPGGAMNQNLGEPDYGVCRGTDPKCFHDWARAKAATYKVLLFTRTAGPRHANLGKPLAEGLNPPLDESNVVQRGMVKLLSDKGIDVAYTEDPKMLTQLNGYHAVIFFSTSRDALDDDAKTALRQYMRAGGGFVGIHNAFGTLYNWPWYEGLLGGANFYDHGPARPGEVVVVDDKDVSTRQLPKRWSFTDEWYNLVPFPTKVRFLATIDEKSWKPVSENEGPRPTPGVAPRSFGPRLPSVVGKHPGHGDFHPVAWCQYYDGGKSWVTTLGHDAAIFGEDPKAFPGAEQFKTMVLNGVMSVMGATPFCQ